MNENMKIENNPCQQPGNSEDNFFRLVNLSKTYLEGSQRRVVLSRTCLTLRKGEFTAILGKSGSGKTTLLNLISGIDCPDEGEIYLNGTCLTSMSDQERTLFRRSQIGFIFQFFNLIPTLTVWENVTLPLELNDRLTLEGKKRALGLLEEVELDLRLKTFPDRLSGGEQQRVAIARALVHDPILVLADEPTGNLDDETGSQIFTLLDRLTRQAGKNLVLVTHNAELAGYSDRAYMLHDGQLHERGIH